MGFEGALAAMRAGFTVRREGWIGDLDWIARIDGAGALVSGSPARSGLLEDDLSSDDLVAEDWVVVAEDVS